MNLVNELQVSAEQDDVLTVLRKAKRLASKLGVDDIGQWLQWEQEGYADSKTLPKYRMVKGRVVFNPTDRQESKAIHLRPWIVTCSG